MTSPVAQATIPALAASEPEKPMRLIAPLCLALLLPPVAAAQELVEVTPSDALAQVLPPLLDTPLLFDMAQVWQGELTDDGLPDLLIQASFSFPEGGNAWVLYHWVFAGQPGGGHLPWRKLDLPGGITAARREGQQLVLTLQTYGPDDARCCPSVIQDMRFGLR
ncbi:hypothetical protein [Gemmobacter serpentinus]|uniref:hypothetical protein n=1 Tax=Gemmobacter serpentinus TaxID=2652247 RepID=UPI00124E454B|nr:hypothetical protein [Gemmobacter serpentinus]